MTNENTKWAYLDAGKWNYLSRENNEFVTSKYSLSNSFFSTNISEYPLEEKTDTGIKKLVLRLEKKNDVLHITVNGNTLYPVAETENKLSSEFTEAQGGYRKYRLITR